MGGSPKPPKQSDAEAKMQAEQLQLQRDQIAIAQKQAADAAKITVPKTLPVPPPPTQGSADIAAAAEDAKRKAAKRTNAARGTLFAGETGGYSAPASGKTLLG